MINEQSVQKPYVLWQELPALLQGGTQLDFCKLVLHAEHRSFYINKIQQDATVCRYLFTEKVLYVFRVSIASIIGST